MKKLQVVLFACLFVLFAGCGGGGGSDEGKNSGSGFPAIDAAFPKFERDYDWLTKIVGYGKITIEEKNEYINKIKFDYNYGFSCNELPIQTTCYKLPPVTGGVSPNLRFSLVGALYDTHFELSKYKEDFSVSLFDVIFHPTNKPILKRGISKRYSENVENFIGDYANSLVGFSLIRDDNHKIYKKEDGNNVYIFGYYDDTIYWEAYDTDYYNSL
ncbi:MAG: hypothetical protein LBH45_07135 [Campylobacteraceae bacterium]|jgi:hypothetical protein|nr:hypothetical protein [Campylobacteraceae bacterium]